jgi:hypothetical protein
MRVDATQRTAWDDRSDDGEEVVTLCVGCLDAQRRLRLAQCQRVASSRKDSHASAFSSKVKAWAEGLPPLSFVQLHGLPVWTLWR